MSDTLDAQFEAFRSENLESAPHTDPVEDTAAGDTTEDAAPSQEDTPASDDRPRGPDGKFLSKAAEARVYAGKYKTAEDLEQAYTQLQSRLGEQGQELGELRRIAEQLEGLPGQMAQAQQPQRQYDWAEAIENDPAQAAMAALEVGDKFALDRAVAAWEEVAPGAPMLWAQNVQMQQRLDALTQTLDERIAPLHQSQNEQVTEQAYQHFSRSHPDMDIAAMLEVAEQSPHLIGLLQAGDVDSKVEVLDYLYWKAKARQPQAPDTPQADPAAAAAQAAADAAQARQDAQVAPSTGATPDAPEPSVADVIVDRWKKFDVGRLKYD